MFNDLFERPFDRRNKRGLSPTQRRLGRLVAGLLVLAVVYLGAVVISRLGGDSGLSDAGRERLLQVCLTSSGQADPSDALIESCESGTDAWEDLMVECNIAEDVVVSATEALAEDGGESMVLAIEESECGGQLPPSMVERLGNSGS